MAELRYLENVVSLQLNKDKCIGCGRCVEVCPHAVFAMNASKTNIVDRNSCMECGACTQNCPTNAIAVQQGVGCATALLKSFFTGNAPSCGCDVTCKGTDKDGKDAVEDSCCDKDKGSCC